MNEDTDDIETQLRRWRPVAVRDDLTRRIALDLEGPHRQRATWWQRLGFRHPMAAVGWGLAAPALIILATLHLDAPGPGTAIAPSVRAAHSSVPPREPTTMQATRITNRRYQTNDEGVVLTREQRPMRQTRYQSEDTIAWQDARTGTQLEVSYPREDVVQIPVTTR